MTSVSQACSVVLPFESVARTNQRKWLPTPDESMIVNVAPLNRTLQVFATRLPEPLNAKHSKRTTVAALEIEPHVSFAVAVKAYGVFRGVIVAGALQAMFGPALSATVTFTSS